MATARWRFERAPLTAACVVCSAKLPDASALARVISAFLDPATHRRWTIELASERGDVELLKRVIAHEASCTDAFYRSHVFSKALVHAVKHDHALELLECLVAFCPQGYAAPGFAEAARLGRIDALTYLLAHCSHIHELPLYAEQAALNGHLDVLQWFKRHSHSFAWRSIATMEHAARGGHLAIVQWIHEQRDGTAPEQLDLYARSGSDLALVQWIYMNGYCSLGALQRVFYTAAAEGFTDTLEWLLTAGFADDCDHSMAFFRAIEHGHLAIAQLLFPRLPPSDYFTKALEDAATHGHLALVQWLVESAPKRDDRSDTTSLLGAARYATTMRSAVTLAAANGRVNVADWLFRRTRELDNAIDARASSEFAVAYDRTLPRAAETGDLHAVQWLVSTMREFSSLPQFTERRAVAAALRTGQQAVVDWLLSHFSMARNCLATRLDVTDIIESGRLDILESYPSATHIGFDTYNVAQAVAANGYLRTLQWLHDRHSSVRWSDQAMDMAAQNNHLHVLKWLHATHGLSCSQDALDNAGGVEVAEWLHTNQSAGCTTAAMDNAAKRGDMETLLFLHAKRREGCSIDAAIEAYANSHVVVFDWLVGTYPDVMELDVIRECVQYCGVPEFASSLLDNYQDHEYSALF